MFLLSKPDPGYVRRFLEKQKTAGFSYPEPGATKITPPAGYNVDHNRILLGRGPEAFLAAKLAVRSWKMFDLLWVQLCWPDAPIEPGSVVAILVSHFGFWSLSAARIVYTIDEPGPVEKFGFAYGTLGDHVESGEERFSVEFRHESGEVWYDLLAFSKPNHIMAKLGYPVSRMLQKRFAVGSLNAMHRAAGSA